MDKTSRAYLIIEEIARDHLGLETIDSRNDDNSDFKELSVWQISKALEEAFDAGYKMCRQSLR
jgi:hypothetical protein